MSEQKVIDFNTVLPVKSRTGHKRNATWRIEWNAAERCFEYEIIVTLSPRIIEGAANTFSEAEDHVRAIVAEYVG